MSKLSIPVIRIEEDDKNTLLTSISEKLNIQNPHFYYPICNKLSQTPYDKTNTILDSKFKCKAILKKLDEDSDGDGYETIDDDEYLKSPSNIEQNKPEFTFTKNDDTPDPIEVENQENYYTGDGEDIYTQEENNESTSNDKSASDNDSTSDNDSNNDDKEIEEAVNNTFMAKALIERINKKTGEKTVKEEEIHIKKTPLLEPLKILQDNYIIPGRIKNKNLNFENDETWTNTTKKIDNHNNSAYVESLFLYLGNKLVETGKCPTFPYYYGSVNGEDPNYHHNITEEYDSVSRTKWFRNRIKNDFDLLIIENDEVEDTENEMLNRLQHRPLSGINYSNKKLMEQLGINDDDLIDTEDDEDDTNPDIDNPTGNDYTGNDDDNDNAVDAGDENPDNDLEDDNESIEEINIIPGESVEIGNEINLDIDNLPLDDILQISKNKEQPIENMDNIDLSIQIDGEDINMNLNNNESNIHAGGNCNLDGDVDGDRNGNRDGDGNCDEDVNSFIEELSDVEADKLDIADFENNTNNLYYLKCAQIPVNLCFMEKLDKTLDNILDDNYKMSELEWFSVFFQVSFGLAIAQKYFNFVHNDLHSSNIMFKETKLRYLYYQVENNYYKIPTFGKITKIIDFARGTFKLSNEWVFSDQFEDDNDASGQYDYPVDGCIDNCRFKPNTSFDLVRLGTTVISRLDECPNVRKFVEEITLDKYDNSLCYDEDTFQLYIDIAHNCNNAIPIEVLHRPEFEPFKIKKEKIPKEQYIFKY